MDHKEERYDEIVLDGVRYKIDGGYLHRLCRLIAREDAEANGIADDPEIMETAGDALYENLMDDELIEDVLKMASRNINRSGLHAVNSAEMESRIALLADLQDDIRSSRLDAIVSVGLSNVDHADASHLLHPYVIVYRGKGTQYMDAGKLVETVGLFKWIADDLSSGYRRLTDICWDTGSDLAIGLPAQVDLPAALSLDDMSEYMSDEYGYRMSSCRLS